MNNTIFKEAMSRSRVETRYFNWNVFFMLIVSFPIIPYMIYWIFIPFLFFMISMIHINIRRVYFKKQLAQNESPDENDILSVVRKKSRRITFSIVIMWFVAFFVRLLACIFLTAVFAGFVSDPVSRAESGSLDGIVEGFITIFLGNFPIR